LARALSRAGLAAFVLGAAAVAFLPLAGYERYVITGGSMGGAIERGSVLWSKPVGTAELKVGDVITYTPPRGSGPEGLVTHRIVWIGLDKHGERMYRTKGDANAAVDPWKFRLDNSTQPRASFHLPYLGHVLAAASDPRYRTIGVGIPAGLVVFVTFSRLWRDAGRHARDAGDQRPGVEGSPA
jgi:signal peptidase